ncbi:MAG: transcriptional repressor [Candidatus Bipolaricaulis sp.]|nr:transcriptional repressor [Candidatus Bipolaricaulis sp.]
MTDRAVNMFETFLRRRGLHVTRSRRAVVEAVFALPAHFEAADLWAALRGVVSSAATVYRTLELLEEAGLVRRVSFGEAHAHYEHVLGREDHGHLVCRRCGRVVEFSDPALKKVVTEAAARHEFTLAEVVVQGYGVCPACRAAGL